VSADWDVSDPVQDAAAAQRAASDPGVSAWVEASAGSGKTKVLTDRALRLMLKHGRPDRILCLTFTKAAATEMANRIIGILAGWATGEPPTVRASLEAMTGAPPDDGMFARARSLFATVIDAPGGLKVQTVHAFCQAALERFPAEAGAPPGFAALDERAAADLLTEARDAVLRAIMAEAAPDGLSAALDRMADRGDSDRLDAVLRALLAERGQIAALGGTARAEAILLAKAGFADLDAAMDSETVSGVFDDSLIGGLRRLAAAWSEGGKNDKKRTSLLLEWLALDSASQATAIDMLFAAFFTASEGKPFSLAAIKDVLDANPWFEDLHADVLAAVTEMRDRPRLAACVLDTIAAMRLAEAVAERYAAMKAARAALDFDDLILLTRDLLTRDGGAGWALYKMDQGLDHILVDEAQDTNPEQWQVIHALAGAFFEDGGDQRTLFAVGDPKQSIFSFQRADPKEFARSRALFREAAAAADQVFRDEELPVSFRSTPAVLKVVDHVFAKPPGLNGLTPDDRPPHHRAARAGLPGRVELWPVVPEIKAEPADPWMPLTEYPDGGESAEARLATMIADKIASLIADPAEVLAPRPGYSGGRRIQAGDIMVVVQRRRKFGDLLARALKLRDVPTAGVDRMALSRQLAIRDLLALGQVAVLPEDDLSLACFLKSPLGGLDEAGLFALAYGRGSRTPLWRRLKHAAAAAPEDSAVSAAWRWVEAAMARADYAPPFDFYQWALGPMQGRARLVANMGEAVLDPLDEFMALALRYGQERPASLSGFLAWIERESVEIKRELEGAHSGVRLLTAHAAKGLQAPIVFLPDTTARPAQDRLRLFWLETESGPAPLLGAVRKAEDPELVAGLADAREKAAAAERRRLLYVAMTRAEDRLYVAGWATGAKNGGRPPGCWHELVQSGLDRMSGVDDVATAYSDEEAMLIYAEHGAASEPASEEAPGASSEPAADLPDWFDAPAPPPGATAPATAPSHAVVDDADDPPAALSPLARVGRRAAAAARFGRGLLIHRLLERLPGVPASARAEVGRVFLRRAADLSSDELEQTLAAALRLIEDPAFGAAFQAGALAEAPIAGRIAGRRYAGVIDRLALDAERALIVDFKTNRPPPGDAAQTPPAYLRQMALYRALARQAFPGLRVETGLLWTEAPRLDMLDDRLLDAFAPGE